MRASRVKRRPTLELLRPESSATDTTAERLVVIQNTSISSTVRFVVLGGDPQGPQRQRPGIATIELFPGSWSPEEQLEIIEFFRAKAEAKWAAEVDLNPRIERSMLRLVEEEE